ncbi:MAG: MarR family transcriptional regulator [Chloroflexi bacterium]|nr:MarR family transcriptional regulator [Chloroflexota bacterium]
MVDQATSATTIESIITELEPMMAYQRKAMMRVWQDRSVSKMTLYALMLLEHDGPLPMSRLAALADVSLSNLTGIVDRMEQHGLVERVRDDRDRRLVLVRSTEKGTGLCAEMDGLRREQLRRLVEELDVADQPAVLQAARALGRAVGRLNTAESTDI